MKASNAVPKIAVAASQNTTASFLPAASPVAAAKKETVSPEVGAWLAQLKSPNWNIRRKAAFELGKIRAVEAVVPLLELLDDENDKACGVAAMALGRIGDKRALKPLIERLEDEALYVRASAAKGLGYLGDTSAAPALRGALKDAAPDVREAAKEALRKLAQTR
jgi:HEAT repeat protein